MGKKISTEYVECSGSTKEVVQLHCAGIMKRTILFNQCAEKKGFNERILAYLFHEYKFN